MSDGRGSWADTSFQVAEDGTFTRKLPAGHMRFHTYLGNRYTKRPYPYVQTYEKNISADADSKLEFLLERKPGVLFKIAKPKPIRPTEDKDSYWERLVIWLQVVGSRKSSSVSDDSIYAYLPVEKWGQEGNIEILLRRKGNNAELMDQNFVADPETWPIMIDAVKMREALRTAEE